MNIQSIQYTSYILALVFAGIFLTLLVLNVTGMLVDPNFVERIVLVEQATDSSLPGRVASLEMEIADLKREVAVHRAIVVQHFGPEVAKNIVDGLLLPDPTKAIE